MKTACIPVIELCGTSYDRGRQYGQAAKELIAQVVEAWRADLGNYARSIDRVNNPDPDSYLDNFLSDTNYLYGIQQWAPTLLDEVKGIADGAGQPFETILGLQLMDEEWIYGLHCGLNKSTTKCTAFGVPGLGNKISYAGQNMDIPSWVEGKQVLLRIMPTENSPEALVFAFAGIIGLNGMNANGLGITCNTLAQLKSSTHGLPVSFIVRSVLEKQNIEDAERFIGAIKHASGQNYILSTSAAMHCFECSADRVVRYAPENAQGRVFHTNHPLVNTDEDKRLPVASEKQVINSSARLSSISHRLGDRSGEMTLNEIKAALSAHDDPTNPVSRRINPDNINSSIGYTAGASIYEFTESPRLHLAAGPPCETNFEVFEF